MNELPFVNDADKFKDVLLGLRLYRRENKIKTKRKYRLTKSDRKTIHEKTDGKCHICGQVVPVEKFEADHVKAHATGGHSYLDNFLPTCKTCNNYRWDYSPDEIKWILKLGIWARKQIENNTGLGRQMAKTFIGYEHNREKRRREPRKSR
jgi:hypothetical protein